METQSSSEQDTGQVTRRSLRGAAPVDGLTRRQRLDARRSTRDYRNRLVGAGLAILVAFGGTLILRETVAIPFTVEQQSMTPTLQDGDVVFVSGATTVQRNDIIVTRSWVGDAFYVKRVIGMPGDNIEYRDGVLWLNGVETPELWEGTDSYQVTVPDGKLWVLGDNRQNSSDSRENGLLERDNVVGVAYMRVLPFDRFTAPID